MLLASGVIILFSAPTALMDTPRILLQAFVGVVLDLRC
jgi:hypothetical protein